MNRTTLILIIAFVALVVIIVVALLINRANKNAQSNTNNSNQGTGNTSNTPPPPVPSPSVVGKQVWPASGANVDIRSSPSVIVGFFGFGSNVICSNPNGNSLVDIVNQDNTSVWSEGWWWGGQAAWYKIKINDPANCGGAQYGYVLADEVVLK